MQLFHGFLFKISLKTRLLDSFIDLIFLCHSHLSRRMLHIHLDFTLTKISGPLIPISKSFALQLLILFQFKVLKGMICCKIIFMILPLFCLVYWKYLWPFKCTEQPINLSTIFEGIFKINTWVINMDGCMRPLTTHTNLSYLYPPI